MDINTCGQKQLGKILTSFIFVQYLKVFVLSFYFIMWFCRLLTKLSCWFLPNKVWRIINPTTNIWRLLNNLISFIRATYFEEWKWILNCFVCSKKIWIMLFVDIWSTYDQFWIWFSNESQGSGTVRNDPVTWFLWPSWSEIQSIFNELLWQPLNETFALSDFLVFAIFKLKLSHN